MASYSFGLSVGNGKWSIYVTKSGGGTGAYDLSCDYNITISGQNFSGYGRYDFRNYDYNWEGSLTVASGSYTAYEGTNSGSGTVDGNSISGSYYKPPSVTTYTITLNANGGEGGASKFTIKSNQTSVTIPSNVPTRTTYTFIGWNTAQDGSGTMYMPGDTWTQKSNKTLYAQWRKKRFVKKNGNWLDILKYWVKVNGVYKEAVEIYTKVNGEWKS